MKIHEYLDQPGGQNSERARPPALKAVGPAKMHAHGSWLGDGEDVQGETAPQGNHELIHVGEPGQQHREGVGAQEQKSVAGVVIVPLSHTSLLTLCVFLLVLSSFYFGSRRCHTLSCIRS